LVDGFGVFQQNLSEFVCAIRQPNLSDLTDLKIAVIPANGAEHIV
jgi:hypothetical protein